MAPTSTRPRLLPSLLVAQALLVASPIATLDNLLTSPRALGAQARRADLPATIASGLPFVVALLPVAMVAVAVAVRRRTPGSWIGAGIVSTLALVIAIAPGQRGMTTAAPLVHGMPLGIVAAATLLVLWRARGERTREHGRSRAGRVTVAAALAWLLALAAVGATRDTIPIGPIGAALSPDLEVSSTTPTAPLDGEPAAQARHLAPNPDSNIHGDAAMTDAYTDREVLDPRGAEVIRRHLGGVCASMLFDEHGRIVAVCVNATRVTLNVLDPDSLEVLAREHVADRPFRADFATNFAGGGYAVLDDEQRVVLPTSDGRITRWSVADSSGEPAIEAVDEFDVTSGLAEGEGINSAVPGTDGEIWVVGQLGSVAVLDPESGDVGSTRFADADIENSFAVGSDGRAWVVTSRELVALRADGATPQVVWRQTYDAGTRRKPGQTSRASGTTPTLLLGERYVAITDNADPRMHVVVYDTRRGLGSREHCRVPVFAPERSATDNSLIAIGSSLFVESNYGYTLFDATFGRSTEPGMTRIDVTDDGCEQVWANDEIRTPSVVSKGTAAGVIATYTKGESVAGIDAWYFTAVDATTGEVMWRRLAGTGPMVNNHYAAIYVGPDGGLYVGATGGIVALRPRT
ncbi:hypothetical protein [Janibacter sp. G368]|uniref:hypothetical protein n=1 Tax=Janibacter sp. G368 TaxID=3420441 RepID=UPI003D058ACC